MRLGIDCEAIAVRACILANCLLAVNCEHQQSFAARAECIPLLVLRSEVGSARNSGQGRLAVFLQCCNKEPISYSCC